MAGFDVAGARKAGYSDDEIAAHLAQDKNLKFDVGGALKAGYSAKEVLDHLGDGGEANPEAAAAEAPQQKPFGEKLKNFLGNVSPQGPISGLIALTRLSGDAAKGNVDLMTDEGINRAIPTVVEGSVAAAPSARARPMPSVAKAPVPEAPPVAPATAPAAAESGGGIMGALSKYGIPIAAEIIGTAHGMPGLATIGRLTAGHLLSKLAAPKEAPLTSRFEGTPSIGDEVAAAKPPAAAPETLRTNPEPIVSPSPSEGNPALAKAREQAQVMNALAELAKQSKAKQQQGAMNAGALEAASGSPMNPGIARLTPEPPTPPIEATPTPQAVPMGAPAVEPAPVSAKLPKDVAAEGKLLSSGLAKIAKMREAAAKAEATPIEKIAAKAKAPKPAPEQEGATLDETFGQPSAEFKPTESDYAHLPIQEAAQQIVDAQKARGMKFWHGEDSYLKATTSRLASKDMIANKVAKVVQGVPAQKIKSWVQGAKNRADAEALRDHLKTLVHKSAADAIDAAFSKQGLKAGWSK